LNLFILTKNLFKQQLETRQRKPPPKIDTASNKNTKRSSKESYLPDRLKIVVCLVCSDLKSNVWMIRESFYRNTDTFNPEGPLSES